MAWSLALHAAVLLCLLLLARHTLSPAGDAPSIELVMLPYATQKGPEPAETPKSIIPDVAPVPEQTPPDPTADQTPPVIQNQPSLSGPPPMPDQMALQEQPPIAPPLLPTQQPVQASDPPPVPPAALEPATRSPQPSPRPSRQSQPPPLHQPSSASAGAKPPTQVTAPHLQTASLNAQAGSPTPPSTAAGQPDSAAPDSAWLADVSAWLLAHRSYPEMARALGRQGTVVVQITVDPNGQVEDVALIHGSGSEALDNAAQTLVRNAHLPPFPPDMKRPRQSVTVPIRYRLE